MVFEVQPVRARVSPSEESGGLSMTCDHPHGSRAVVVDLQGDGTETVAGFFVKEQDLQHWLAAPTLAVSRTVELESDTSGTQMENPDGKISVIEWSNGSQIYCTTLHTITFDARTRFAKFRNPVRARSGYQLRVRLGDWAGHGPAYLAIVNAGFKGPPTEAAGVPLPDGCLWDFFDLDGAKLQAALGCACEVVVASPA